LKRRHLRVADRLERDAERAEARRRRIDRAERPRARHADEERRGDEPRKHALNGEHEVQALESEARLVGGRGSPGSGGLRRAPSCAA
jgi:hypothetical protein